MDQRNTYVKVMTLRVKGLVWLDVDAVAFTKTSRMATNAVTTLALDDAYLDDKKTLVWTVTNPGRENLQVHE